MPKRQRTPIERERQILRTKLMRLLARCNKYGIKPWEFYSWCQLKEAALELAALRGTDARYPRHMTLEEYIKVKHEPAVRENMLFMLVRMGKINASTKPPRTSYDHRYGRHASIEPPPSREASGSEDRRFDDGYL